MYQPIKNVAPGDHVRWRRTTVLTRRHDKVEGRRGTARNGREMSGLEMNGFSSTNRKRGAWRPCGMVWNDEPLLWDAINERTSEGEAGF